MQCLTLAKNNWTVRAIADEVGCSKTTVGHVLTDYDYDTFTSRLKSTGRPHKTTDYEDRLIIQAAKANHHLPFRNITNIHGLPVSPKTTTCQCQEVDLISLYARSKPFLMAKHKKDRLEWALYYVDWIVED